MHLGDHNAPSSQQNILTINKGGMLCHIHNTGDLTICVHTLSSAHIFIKQTGMGTPVCESIIERGVKIK